MFRDEQTGALDSGRSIVNRLFMLLQYTLLSLRNLGRLGRAQYCSEVSYLFVISNTQGFLTVS